MNAVPTFNQALSLGSMHRSQCDSISLTQKEIAIMAGVSKKEVELFERDQYLRPITRQKIIRAFELIKWEDNKTTAHLLG